MKTVKIADLKDNLSEHLRAVERGAEVVVTDRNRPIARIIPESGGAARLTLIAPSVTFASIRSRKHRRARWPVESGALLRDERREKR